MWQGLDLVLQLLGTFMKQIRIFASVIVKGLLFRYV